MAGVKVNSIIAASLIRECVVRQLVSTNKSGVVASVKRTLLGLTERELRAKKVLLGPKLRAEKPFCCIFRMTRKGLTGNEILLKNVGQKVILSLGGSVGGVFCPTVANVATGYGAACNADTIVGIGKSAVSNSAGADFLAKANQGWVAGMNDAVNGTDNEFAFSEDLALAQGFATFEEEEERIDIYVQLMTKSDFLHHMTIAEGHADTAKYMRAVAKGSGCVKYRLDLAQSELRPFQ